MIPTPHTVAVRNLMAGAEDDFGIPGEAWAETTWAVHAIAPGTRDEADRTNRNLSTALWTVYGPKTEGAPTGARSQVRLPGSTEWLEVEGDVKDWTLGPWPHPTAGLAVELRRADG